MNLIGAAILSILCLLVLGLPRRYAAAPFLICMLYLTMGQVVVIGGLHIYAVTTLAVFGILRLILWQEWHLYDADKITVSIFLFAIAALTANFILTGFNDGIARTRTILESLMLYVFFKSVFRSVDDCMIICKLMPLLMVPVACSMLWESLTGHNIFSYFSGVPDMSYIRNGRYRCQGPFGHPILAGTFGATVLPLIIVLWFQESYRKRWCILGAICSVIIVFTSVSSGAMATFFLEIAAIGFWRFRNNMRWVRRGLIAMLCILPFLIKASLWHIFDLLSKYGGGTGRYRSELLDAAFGKHFREWWLIGTTYTRHWTKTGLDHYNNSSDIVSQYLIQGVQGGVFTMAIFIVIMICCFKAIGRALHRDEGQLFSKRVFLWALGATLFGHVVSFLSVSYFDQSIIWYFMLIGMIGAISAVPAATAQKT